MGVSVRVYHLRIGHIKMLNVSEARITFAHLPLVSKVSFDSSLSNLRCFAYYTP